MDILSVLYYLSFVLLMMPSSYISGCPMDFDIRRRSDKAIYTLMLLHPAWLRPSVRCKASFVENIGSTQFGNITPALTRVSAKSCLKTKFRLEAPQL
ncbi:hypothetical protein F5050DRAFT_767053 [Lentinula boryana]|uniref:Secreted protein n=1 Tax=Lentinula boryana TaxID=40481 RepID=A0ABQ8Q311_9AGAR|nr:hypothetical protein F5050DRAFT_767053 [Lentinula boryana]